MTLRRWFYWFIASGIGGALLDQFHTQLGVLSYRDPFFLGQAWWVVPNFGVGFTVFLVLAFLFVRGAHQYRTPTTETLLSSGALFVAAYLISCFDGGHPWWMLIGFVVVWLFRVARSSAPRTVAAFSLLLAALGTGYEMTLTSTGVYYFHRPDVLTVPAWLPGLYLIGAPFGLMLAKRLSRPRS